MNSEVSTRPLTDDERSLALWMLEHGNSDACGFIEQLKCAEATTWRCVCGCSSFNFKVTGHPPAPPGVHVLGDFVFGSTSDIAGIFIFECQGILSGVEVYGLAGDAPPTLPKPEQLRTFDSIAKTERKASQ